MCAHYIVVLLLLLLLLLQITIIINFLFRKFDARMNEWMNDDVIYAIIRKLFALACIQLCISSVALNRFNGIAWLVGCLAAVAVIARSVWMAHITYAYDISIHPSSEMSLHFTKLVSAVRNVGSWQSRKMCFGLFVCKMLYYNKAAIKPHLMWVRAYVCICVYAWMCEQWWQKWRKPAAHFSSK